MAGMSRIRMPVAFVAVAVAIIAVACLSAWRVSSLAAAFPDPVLVEHRLGEEVVGGEIGIRATDAAILDRSKVLALAPGYSPAVLGAGGEPLGADDERVCLVTLVVTNNGEKAQVVPLQNFRAQSLYWQNGINMPLYGLLNESPGLRLSLEAGQSVTVRLPFSAYSVSFMTDSEWASFAQRPFDLVLSIYPARHVVHLLDGGRGQ
jgi:hypothetical protein